MSKFIQKGRLTIFNNRNQFQTSNIIRVNRRSRIAIIYRQRDDPRQLSSRLTLDAWSCGPVTNSIESQFAGENRFELLRMERKEWKEDESMRRKLSESRQREKTTSVYPRLNLCRDVCRLRFKRNATIARKCKIKIYMYLLYTSYRFQKLTGNTHFGIRSMSSTIKEKLNLSLSVPYLSFEQTRVCT